MLNKNHSEETKRKISIASKGNKSFTGRKHTEEWKQKMSLIMKAKPRHPNFTTKGKKRPPASMETRIKLGIAHRGAKNHNWKGGVTSISQKIRHSLEYKLWREAVFQRDGSKCVQCGIAGTIDSPYLRADHIKSFAMFPELRTEISNGQVLCLNCDSQTNTWGRKVKYILTSSN